jgi:ferric-dicitrate binding protein FerR (iron transport regulator)
MNMKNYHATIEDFLLSDRFVEMVKKNDSAEIRLLMEEFPHSRQVIEDAMLLVMKMKTEDNDLPTNEQTEKELNKFNTRIRKRQFVTWFTRTAAAIALLIIALTGLYSLKHANNTDNVHEIMFSMFDSSDISKGEIRLIAGDYRVDVNEKDTIVQNRQGETVIGGQKIEKEITETVEYLQLVVPYGKRSKLTFNDGTRAYVNSGTTVLYPKKFKKNSREIFVDGEIFMEVARDESRPFKIHTKKLSVSVLGTTLNINSYNDDDAAAVVLVEGSVEVSSGNHKNKLLPNQAFLLENDASEIKTVNVYSYICWKEGYMKIDDESLETIFEKLSRYYNIRFHYDNTATASETFAGKLDLSESIEDVLHSISFSTPFIFEKEGDMINIKPNY